MPRRFRRQCPGAATSPANTNTIFITAPPSRPRFHPRSATKCGARPMLHVQDRCESARRCARVVAVVQQPDPHSPSRPELLQSLRLAIGWTRSTRSKPCALARTQERRDARYASPHRYRASRLGASVVGNAAPGSVGSPRRRIRRLRARAGNLDRQRHRSKPVLERYGDHHFLG